MIGRIYRRNQLNSLNDRDDFALRLGPYREQGSRSFVDPWSSGCGKNVS